MTSSELTLVTRWLQEAKRPIFIWGAGIRPYAKEALELARSLGIPIATTWGSIDCINHNDPLMAGGFGTHGTRAANFSVQNSDLVVSIGSRLDTKATGSPPHFARAAKVVMVDIDPAEIKKFDKLGRRIDLGLPMDAGEFIAAFSEDRHRVWFKQGFHWDAWITTIHRWRRLYDTPTVTWPGINPYELVKEIGKWTTKDDVIVSDTGTALGYLMQAFPFKGERFLHAFNMTPMGYGLGAAIGSALATEKRVVLITGDGSLMMSLTELTTIARWNLNIKIILLNNHQHSMCVQTEQQWFGGRNAGTTIESGLGFPPSFAAVARSFAIPTREDITSLFETEGPCLCEVEIPREAKIMAQARYGFPLEDQEPYLPRDELREQMIVAPL